MNKVHVEASATIDARAEEIYAVLADYRTGHPAIVPKAYFTSLEVEKGGQGAGTIVQIRMKVFGVERAFRQLVSEPEPGRVLVEADLASDLATTFTVEPVGGVQSRVTIATDFAPSPGITGFVERVLNPPVLRRIYREELKQLAAYMKAQHTVDAS